MTDFISRPQYNSEYELKYLITERVAYNDAKSQ